MKNLEDMIINSSESDEANHDIDPSQRKNHELLQSKYKKPAETRTSTLASRDTNDDKSNETVDFKSIKLGSLTCLAQSLSAYLITKNNKKGSDKLRTITVKIYDSVNLWLSRLFR